jgi:hypothetical protein
MEGFRKLGLPIVVVALQAVVNCSTNRQTPSETSATKNSEKSAMFAIEDVSCLRGLRIPAGGQRAGLLDDGRGATYIYSGEVEALRDKFVDGLSNNGWVISSNSERPRKDVEVRAQKAGQQIRAIIREGRAKPSTAALVLYCEKP